MNIMVEKAHLESEVGLVSFLLRMFNTMKIVFVIYIFHVLDVRYL